MLDRYRRVASRRVARPQGRFDDEDAVYMAVFERNGAAPLASLRLLRTDGTHCARDSFSFLYEQPVPRGPDIRKISRLRVSSELDPEKRIAVRNRLVRGLLEYAAARQIRSFTYICEMGYFAELLSTGWGVDPLGLPRPVGRRMLCACRIDLPDNACAQLPITWRDCEGDELAFSK